jgi:hypothetical protein
MTGATFPSLMADVTTIIGAVCSTLALAPVVAGKAGTAAAAMMMSTPPAICLGWVADGALHLMGLVRDSCPLQVVILGKDLHSSTFRFNLSAFCGIGGAFSGYLGGIAWGIRGYLGDIWGCLGCVLCQKRLRLS